MMCQCTTCNERFRVSRDDARRRISAIFTLGQEIGASDSFFGCGKKLKKTDR